MMYMLDTNVIVTAIRKKSDRVREKLVTHLDDGLCISAITYTELIYGVNRSTHPRENLEALQRCLAYIEILPFDISASVRAGEMMADLAANGERIGDRDMLIAGHAKAMGIIFVTHNTREFQRVSGLQIEDWETA